MHKQIFKNIITLLQQAFLELSDYEMYTEITCLKYCIRSRLTKYLPFHLGKVLQDK